MAAFGVRFRIAKSRICHSQYVQLGSYLVTDLATTVSVCHILHAKFVLFFLNHRGTIFHENMLLLAHLYLLAMLGSGRSGLSVAALPL